LTVPSPPPTPPQPRVKVFASNEAALAEARKTVQQKVKKGYVMEHERDGDNCKTRHVGRRGVVLALPGGRGPAHLVRMG
jgi:hypothetical protein